MKITNRQLKNIIAELSFARDPDYESERWQQEHLNKVQLEDKLEQIQQDLASKGVELVILTDDKSGTLADNEIMVIVRRKKSGLMGMLGGHQDQSLMFYTWPNGISVKDINSGEDPLSLEPGQVDRWLQQNIVAESKIRITKQQLHRIINETVSALNEYYKEYEETEKDYEEGEALQDELEHAASRRKRDRYRMMTKPPIGNKKKKKGYISKKQRMSRDPAQFHMPWWKKPEN